MVTLFQNKHFVTTAAKVAMYCVTLVVVAVVFWRAPEQAVEIMKAGMLMLGGAVIGPKLGIKI